MKIFKTKRKIALIAILMTSLIMGYIGDKKAVEVERNIGSEIVGEKVKTTEPNINPEELAKEESISVMYNSHIQDIGWEEDFSKKDGERSGTEGKSYRLEGMKIRVNNESSIKIKYQTHIQNIGWQEWKYNGEMAGTQGKSLRLEAIRIQLENTSKYSVMYRVHIQNIGWQEWMYDGEMAGTEGKSLRLEAIEIKIVPKEVKIKYSTHVQNIGWQNWKTNGEMAGTEGKSLRLEAIKISTNNLPEGSTLEYQVHVQDIGWQGWKQNGKIAGTSGLKKRLEAIKIKINGTSDFSIIYRVHVQDVGWQNWCYDGETAGTEGLSKRLEGIEIKVIPKITDIKSKVVIDTPIKQIGNTLQKITGWTMNNFENAQLKLYLDNDEVPTNNIIRKKNINIINTQKGYGDETLYNNTPEFELIADFSKYTLGNHTLTVKVLKDSEVINEENRNITIREKITDEIGTYGITGLKVAGDERGTDLNYYKYGHGPNVFFAVFAIHGYEDIWEKDGQELVTIADNFHQRLINDNDYDLADKWTIYILPGVNKDGLNYGYTNNGPGRTTLFSQAPENQGIDMNRCWQVGNSYTIYTNSRNYNGTTGFQAYESQYLRDFLLANKSTNGQTLLVDLHGWTQQLIGDSAICSYYEKQFPENDKSGIGRYGTGYLVNWARVNLGSSNATAKAALIELPNEGVNGHQSVINKNFSNRYIEATLDMLKNI